MTRVEAIVRAVADDIGGADACVYVTPIWYMDLIEVKAVGFRTAFEHIRMRDLVELTEPQVCLLLLDACERTARLVSGTAATP